MRVKEGAEGVFELGDGYGPLWRDESQQAEESGLPRVGLQDVADAAQRGIEGGGIEGG